MALNFPATPTDGQVYENYIWSQAAGTWQSIKKLTNVEVSTSQPTGLVDGQLWFNETDQKLYIFYNSSWILVNA